MEQKSKQAIAKLQEDRVTLMASVNASGDCHWLSHTRVLKPGASLE